MSKSIIISFLFLILLSGCTSVYHGYKKAQWEKMTEEERSAAIKEFEKLEREKYLLIHGDSRDNATEAFTQRTLGTH